MRYWIIIIVTFALTTGCKDSPPATNSSGNKLPNSESADQGVVSTDDLLKLNFHPSERTLNEVEGLLKPGMTVDELQQLLQTTPIVVSSRRIHWMLKDGSIWTDVEPGAKGALIKSIEKEKVN